MERSCQSHLCRGRIGLLPVASSMTLGAESGDGDTHRNAIDAWRRQADFDAIEDGIAQMQAGEVVSLDVARKGTQERSVSRKPESC